MAPELSGWDACGKISRMHSDTHWTPFVKQLVTVALLVAVVFLLSRVSVIIAPLIIALFLAYLVSVPIPWAQRNTGWSRTAVVAVVQVLAVLVLFALPAAIAPRLVNAVGAFSVTFTKVVNELLSVTPKPIEITPDLVINLGPFYQPINQWLQSVVGPELGNISNMQTLVTPFASGLTTVLRARSTGSSGSSSSSLSRFTRRATDRASAGSSLNAFPIPGGLSWGGSGVSFP